MVETRIYVCDIDQWESIGREHDAPFGSVHLATAMVEVSRLAPGLAVEISVPAIVGPDAVAKAGGHALAAVAAHVQLTEAVR